MKPTEEQFKVIETFGVGQAVYAGAGCGKSTTLVAKCLKLLERNPQARFVAVSFTEKSTEDLKRKIADRIPTYAELGSRSGYWVMTIHGLCRTIIREFPLEAGLVGDEKVLAESEAKLLWEQALREFWFEELPEDMTDAFERFSLRESRQELEKLFARINRLDSFGTLERMLESEDADTRDLARLSTFVLERYRALKRKRGVLDFDDLERFAARALGNADVRRTYHRRFDLVLVDEFQDTNPVQSEILRAFARVDGSNLCVVGDPKQSIYRFRDADVSLFEEFCSRMPSQHTLSLNFRSRPEVIDFTNRVCADLFAASQLRYDALQATREPLLDPRGTQRSVFSLEVPSPSDLAAFVKARVAQGERIGDAALLLRKIRGNEKWLMALSRAGIPISVESGGFFWDDPRVHEMVAFLKWWMDPANRLSGAIFLRAPWMRIPDAQLDSWNAQDPTWMRPFYASQHTVALALDPLRGKTLRPSELLEALVREPGVEAELGLAYLGLWHRCEEWSLIGLSFEEVVRECARAIEEGRRDREYPTPLSEGRLRVLTVHGSKGLEFKTVILVDLQIKNRAQGLSQILWDRRKGVFLVRKDPDGDAVVDEPSLAEWKALEREQEVAESKRVFYVALTRAMDRLILVQPVEPIDPKVDLAKAQNEDHWRAWVARARWKFPPTASVCLSDVGASEPEREDVEELRAAPFLRPLALRRVRHSVSEWLKLEQCQRRYAWELLRQSEIEEAPSVEGDVPLEESVVRSSGALRGGDRDQNELGTAVHEALEQGNAERLGELEKEWGSARFSAQQVKEWLERTPFFSQGLVEGRDYWTELAFEVPVGRDVLVGSCDRLVLRDGTWHLIDFKVTASARTEEELLRDYRKQLEWYAWSLCQLEPRFGEAMRTGRAKAWLINFHPRGVTELEVPFRGDIDAAAMADLASRVLSSGDGAPTTGAHCRYCPALALCDAGSAVFRVKE